MEFLAGDAATQSVVILYKASVVERAAILTGGLLGPLFFVWIGATGASVVERAAILTGGLLGPLFFVWIGATGAVAAVVPAAGRRLGVSVVKRTATIGERLGVCAFMLCFLASGLFFAASMLGWAMHEEKRLTLDRGADTATLDDRYSVLPFLGSAWTVPFSEVRYVWLERSETWNIGLNIAGTERKIHSSHNEQEIRALADRLVGASHVDLIERTR